MTLIIEVLLLPLILVYFITWVLQFWCFPCVDGIVQSYDWLVQQFFLCRSPFWLFHVLTALHNLWVRWCNTYRVALWYCSMTWFDGAMHAFSDWLILMVLHYPPVKWCNRWVRLTMRWFIKKYQSSNCRTWNGNSRLSGKYQCPLSSP